MNISTSIHETQVDAVVAKTHHSSEIERLHPSDINIELYSAGFFDGLMGLNAELPHFYEYWDGYQIGYREYCCRLLGVEIPVAEIPTGHLASLMAA